MNLNGGIPGFYPMGHISSYTVCAIYTHFGSDNEH